MSEGEPSATGNRCKEQALSSCAECAQTSHAFLASAGENGVVYLDRDRVRNQHTAGTVLYSQGEEVQEVHCIYSAVVALTCSSPGGRDTIISVVRGGQIIGLAGLFGEGRHSCTAKVIRPGIACTIRSETLEMMTASSASFGRSLLREMSIELHGAIRHASIIAGARLEPKLATLLLDMASCDDDGLQVVSSITRRNLAKMCGVRAEAIVRCLTRWHTKNWIRTDNSRIILLAQARLCELVRSA